MSALTGKTVLFRAHASCLENVKKLNCWGAELNDVSIIRRMPNVEILSLSVNSISTLQDFKHCHKLAELYIRKNDIRDIEEIRYLKNLQRLRVLWISDNECANTENYRATVLKNLPRLQKLDNTVVTPEERETAMQEGRHIAVSESVPDAPSNLSTNASCTSSQPSESASSVGPLGPRTADNSNRNRSQAASALEETNKLRAELGIKPLILSESRPSPSRTHTSSKTICATKTSNVMTAVLALIHELDVKELETVQDKVKERLEEIHPQSTMENNNRSKRRELELN